MSPVLPIALTLVAAKAAVEITLLTLARRHALTLRAAADMPAGVASVFTDRAAYDKAMDYSAAKSRDAIAGELVEAALTTALLLGGAAWVTGGFGALIGRGDAWREALVALGVFTAVGLAEIPLELWGTFRTEARFGFNRTTPRLWLTDKLKGALIGLPLMAALLTPLAWFLNRAPDTWWIWACGTLVGFQLLAAGVLPALLLPVFNKLTPPADPALGERLLALARRAGFPATAVLVMDGSRRSAHANAFFTGFGRMRRIVLFDTLVEKLEPAELEAVLAHEIGHWKRGHIARTMALAAACTVPVFAVAGWFSARPEFLRELGFAIPAGATATPFGDLIPVFATLAGAALFWLTPPRNALSRRHEYEADAYAAELCGGPGPLVNGLRKLYAANSGNPLPHPAYALFHHSHPTLPEREHALTR